MANWRQARERVKLMNWLNMIAEESKEPCFFYLFFQILLKQETSNYPSVPGCRWAKRAKAPVRVSMLAPRRRQHCSGETDPGTWPTLGRLGMGCAAWGWGTLAAGRPPDWQSPSSPLCCPRHRLGLRQRCWFGRRNVTQHEHKDGGWSRTDSALSPHPPSR